MKNTPLFSLSDEQQSFICEALGGNNVLVDACVGSGKTTAIQELCNAYPVDTKILYLTYNKLLKIDAKSKITSKNVTVTNYHGFASSALRKKGVRVGVSDLIQTFNAIKPETDIYDVLVLDEYQDIDLELSQMLEYIKSTNPTMQIIAVGDIDQKIYDKTSLDIKEFIGDFLGNHIKLKFTKCFRLSSELAEKLGRIWKKTIVGMNSNCTVDEVDILHVVDFLSAQDPKDILCLGSRKGYMSRVLNILESKYPEKFNKKTVYASIQDTGDAGAGATEPNESSAIFTTFDSCKGLERKICVVFDFTESYWHTRVSEPLTSQEIIRNVFCVAASRGKEKIFFVKSDEEMLSEDSLLNIVPKSKHLKDMDISSMFDFKYKEDLEFCYSLLDINQILKDDFTEIDIKTADNLIDLSPCVGIYQEAVFFDNYSVDKGIEFLLSVKKTFGNRKNSSRTSLDEKILFQTALETGYHRYITQVKPPFIADFERSQIIERLSTEFSRNEQVQVECAIDFADKNNNLVFSAKGLVDVLKSNTVYELKFVSELKHEHFLQCACYVVALGLEKGILWNVRKNQQYEIKIPNKKAFLNAVTKTITKSQIEEHYKPKSEYISIIDTETNWKDQVMSIGLVLADSKSFEIIDAKYYIITPECTYGGMYSNSLDAAEQFPSFAVTRAEAIAEIKSILKSNNISSVFAYNASFDQSHLPELDNCVRWYDIMKLAAYRQFNKKIPACAECYNTGRLKRNYGVEPILKLLTDNDRYFETHNALLDAIDELKIMKLLGHKIDVYRKNALCEKKKPNCHHAPKQNGFNTSLPNKKGYATTNKPSFYAPDWKFSDYNSFSNNYSGGKLFTIEELAKASNMSKKDVYRLILNGELVAEKINGEYMIEEKEIYNYNKSHKEVDELLIACYVGFGVLAFIIAAIISFAIW